MPVSEPALDSPDRQFVDSVLLPLDGEPSGADLSYDPQFLELSVAAAGRPETQFSAAEPPAWPEVKRLAEDLLTRTRDLRIGTLWMRAAIASSGLLGLSSGLRLLVGWLTDRWDDLHPTLDPDDGDAFERISALGILVDLKGLLGELRNTPLAHDRRLGGIRVRDIEVALDRLPPRADDQVLTLAQIEGQLADLPELSAQLLASCSESLGHVVALQKLMNDRLGAEQAVDLKPLRGMLEAVKSVMPAPADPSAAAGTDADGLEDGAEAGPAAAGSPAKRRAGNPGAIESRQDAVKAIQAICAYLEKSEPTNPAQLLLRRAERLIGKNFLQLVRDFAPDAMNEVARIMGVDPETVTAEDEA